MKTTGTYILLEAKLGHKRLEDQPWPVTEEIVDRFRKNGYVFQKFEEEPKRAYFSKME